MTFSRDPPRGLMVSRLSKRRMVEMIAKSILDDELWSRIEPSLPPL